MGDILCHTCCSPICHKHAVVEDIAPQCVADDDGCFLYLGAGVGMLLLGLLRRKPAWVRMKNGLDGRILPYTVAMVVLDIAAPIFLMFGLKTTAAANASLLNNFEIVATAVIALWLFHEQISRRLWIAIVLVTIACALLTVDDASSLSFRQACCWFCQHVSAGDWKTTARVAFRVKTLEIVTIKGSGSGLGRSASL